MMPEAQSQLAIIQDFRSTMDDRIAALQILARLGDQSVIYPLGVLLGETPTSFGLLMSAFRSALSDLSATELLMKKYDSKDAAVRAESIFILGNIKAAAAVPLFVKALKDPAARVREEAASALYEMKDTTTVPALEEVLISDSDARVRSAAAQALGELRTGAAVVALERAYPLESDDFVQILIERSISRAR